MIDPNVLTGALIVMMLGAGLLHILPKPCTCEKCGFHVNEKRIADERARVKRHKDLHRYLNMPWGDDRCPGCRAGNKEDEHA